MIHCPNSCKGLVVKNGMSRAKQRYKCTICNKAFVPNSRRFLTSEEIESVYERYLISSYQSLAKFCSESECSPATIYKHFADLDKRVMRLHKSICEDVLALVEKKVSIFYSQLLKMKRAGNDLQVCCKLTFKDEITYQPLFVITHLETTSTTKAFSVNYSNHIGQTKKVVYPFNTINDWLDADTLAKEMNELRKAFKKDINKSSNFLHV